MGPVHTAKALPAPPPHTRHRGALWGHWGPTGVAGTRRLSRPTAARTGQRPRSLPAVRRHFRQLFQTLVTSGSPCAAPVWVCAGPARPESGVATQGLACLSRSEAGGAQLGVRSPRAQSRGTALPPAASRLCQGTWPQGTESNETLHQPRAAARPRLEGPTRADRPEDRRPDRRAGAGRGRPRAAGTPSRSVLSAHTRSGRWPGRPAGHGALPWRH